jgi:hypothetical protein
MNNSDGVKQDKHDDIPGLLKKLPKINTSGDFEQQLYRKISAEQESPIQPGYFEKIFRMPAIGYSLAALFLICGLSIYVMYRTRSLEVQESRNIPSISSQPSETTTPSMEKGVPESALQLQQNEKVPLQGKETPESKSPAMKARQSPQQGGVNVPGTAGGKFSASGEKNQRLEKAGAIKREIQAEVGKVQLQDNSSQPALEPKRTTETEVNSRTAKKQVVPSLGISSDVKMAAPAVGVDSVETLKSLAPSIMRNKTSQAPSLIFGKGVRLLKDSVTHADSVRLDSLKRTRDSIKIRNR